MAPHKGKLDSHDEDTMMVLNYLREQNRPYSAIEVSANLHSKVTKAQATKLLKELHQSGQIEERVAGKQVVYHALQDVSQDATPEVMAALNQDIERAQNQLSTVKADVKRVRATLTALDAKPRVSDLERDIGQLEAERDAVQTNLEGSQEPPITVEDRNKLEQEWKQWQRHAATRRRICRDLWGQCTEGLPENTSAHELWESLGLEGTFTLQ